MASTYSFPRLACKDIVKILVELEIGSIRESDLVNPTTDFVSQLYTSLLIFLDPLQDDHGQADFHALGRLDNPDQHLESVRFMNLLRKIKEVVAAVRCPMEFTCKDLIKPDPHRTGVFLSAILNYCLHRQSKLSFVQQHVEQYDILEEKKTNLEARIAQLNNEISEINAANEMEQPLLLEADAKVKELSQTIQGLNNHQMSLKGTFRMLRDKAKEIDEKLTNAEFTLTQSAQENTKLRSQIVQSPEKLQGALEEKKLICDEMKNSERSAMQSFHDKTTILEMYSKSCKKLTKHLPQMQALQEQVTSTKKIEKDVKVLKNKLSEDSVNDKSLEAQLVEREGYGDLPFSFIWIGFTLLFLSSTCTYPNSYYVYLVEQMKESRKAVERERDLKHEEATKELNNVKLDVESKRHNLESRGKRVEAMCVEVDNIELKMDSVRQSGLLKQQELHRRCEEIVNEFHNYSQEIRDNLQVTEASVQGER